MDKARYAAGLKTRREVLGDAHVDASMAQVDELTKPLQDLVCEYGWGGDMGATRFAAQNPKHAQHRHVDRVEPSARIASAPQRRD